MSDSAPRRQIVLVTEGGAVIGPYEVTQLEQYRVGVDIDQVTVTVKGAD